MARRPAGHSRRTNEKGLNCGPHDDARCCKGFRGGCQCPEVEVGFSLEILEGLLRFSELELMFPFRGRELLRKIEIRDGTF